jgi:hypothetical protein
MVVHHKMTFTMRISSSSREKMVNINGKRGAAVAAAREDVIDSKG